MEICRFCLESDHVEKLISPCNCSGSQKFVHLECITRWQETKLKKVFSYPEIYDFTDVRTCNVCKGQFDIKIAPKYWKLANLASPLFKFTLKYWYSFLLGLIILALFSGVLLIPFALNTISIVVGFYIFCKIQGIRPTIFANESGLRLGLIRIGDPVDFIRPGILIKATEKISSGIFAGSIILITAYSVEEGAVGFIINKRINSALGDCIGGPVYQDSRHMIHNCAQVRGCQKVAEDIYVGGSVSSLTPGAKSIICLGYCGWASRQLDGEIRAGCWEFNGEAKSEELFQY